MALTCKHCDVSSDEKEFVKRKNSASGYLSVCRDCWKAFVTKNITEETRAASIEHRRVWDAARQRAKRDARRKQEAAPVHGLELGIVCECLPLKHGGRLNAVQKLRVLTISGIKVARLHDPEKPLAVNDFCKVQHYKNKRVQSRASPAPFLGENYVNTYDVATRLMDMKAELDKVKLPSARGLVAKDRPRKPRNSPSNIV